LSTDPNRSLPGSYRQLNEFAVRFSEGSVVYEAGVVLDRFFIVLSGVIRIESVDSQGVRSPAGEAGRGQLIGHAAAFQARPTETVATTVEDAVLIAIPVDRATEAFALSAELALAVARDLARIAPSDLQSEIPAQINEQDAARSEAPAVPATAAVDQGAAANESAPVSAGVAADGESGWTQSLTRLTAEFDDDFFFKDTNECPACGNRFEYLRVRNAAVRPESRDTDFHVIYRSEDPTRYVVVVCPTCSYAALHDDFASLEDQERGAIVGARQARGRYDYPNLCHLRSLDNYLTALQLAQSCYKLRSPSERRNAVLNHRRAWIEREREDEAAELEWLEKARDSYRRSFELDGEISDESAMRVAFLIGDLSLRLGEPLVGAQWLETATRFPKAKQSSGLERSARERLSDAHRLLTDLEAGQKSA